MTSLLPKFIFGYLLLLVYVVSSLLFCIALKIPEKNYNILNIINLKILSYNYKLNKKSFISFFNLMFISFHLSIIFRYLCYYLKNDAFNVIY